MVGVSTVDVLEKERANTGFRLEEKLANAVADSLESGTSPTKPIICLNCKCYRIILDDENAIEFEL